MPAPPASCCASSQPLKNQALPQNQSFLTSHWPVATSGLSGKENEMVAMSEDTSFKGFIIFINSIQDFPFLWGPQYPLQQPENPVLYFLTHHSRKCGFISPAFWRATKPRGFPSTPCPCQGLPRHELSTQQGCSGGSAVAGGHHHPPRLTQPSLLAKHCLRCSLLYSQLMNQDLRERKKFKQGNLTNLRQCLNLHPICLERVNKIFTITLCLSQLLCFPLGRG